ncbi:MAG: hypothetical protein KF805_02110 [Phycisphaeraceae bacterium]|nr:hypothetical protein [Phycisphaeraceae bacterium]
MHTSTLRTLFARSTFALALLGAIVALSGCAAVGPASIANGRAVYNEVINSTEDEQLLNVIVRERYDQTFGMLTVASVTASIKVSANVNGQFGIGPKESYAGNIVPLSAGVAYEESPTISYIPLSGEMFLSRMLTPITLSQALLLLGAAEDEVTWMRQLYKRINGIDNPIDEPAPEKLERFFALQAKLRKAGVTTTGRCSGSGSAEPEFCVRVSGYEAYKEEVREILDILGIKDVAADGHDIVLPMSVNDGPGGTSMIRIQLRSALDVIRIAGRSIDIPAQEEQDGVAPTLDSTIESEHRLMTIHTSKSYPRNAVVAIPFRNWWYYVDATDTRSKRAFKILRLLVGLRMQESAGEHPGPVLTIPAR